MQLNTEMEVINLIHTYKLHLINNKLKNLLSNEGDPVLSINDEGSGLCVGEGHSGMFTFSRRLGDPFPIKEGDSGLSSNVLLFTRASQP